MIIAMGSVPLYPCPDGRGISVFRAERNQFRKPACQALRLAGIEEIGQLGLAKWHNMWLSVLRLRIDIICRQSEVGRIARLGDYLPAFVFMTKATLLVWNLQDNTVDTGQNTASICLTTSRKHAIFCMELSPYRCPDNGRCITSPPSHVEGGNFFL